VIELASLGVRDAGAADPVDVGANLVEHVRVGKEAVLLEKTLACCQYHKTLNFITVSAAL